MSLDHQLKLLIKRNLKCISPNIFQLFRIAYSIWPQYVLMSETASDVWVQTQLMLNNFISMRNPSFIIIIEYPPLLIAYIENLARTGDWSSFGFNSWFGVKCIIPHARMPLRLLRFLRGSMGTDVVNKNNELKNKCWKYFAYDCSQCHLSKQNDCKSATPPSVEQNDCNLCHLSNRTIATIAICRTEWLQLSPSVGALMCLDLASDFEACFYFSKFYTGSCQDFVIFCEFIQTNS